MHFALLDTSPTLISFVESFRLTGGTPQTVKVPETSESGSYLNADSVSGPFKSLDLRALGRLTVINALSEIILLE